MILGTTGRDAWGRNGLARGYRGMLLESSLEDSERREALGDLRRLTNIILDNLERGSKERLLEPKEIRLLGSTAIRSIRLWLTALERAHTKDPEMTSGHSGEKVGSTGQEV